MHLGLCSGAAPEATLAELVEVCTRRALAALELREGDAHGLSPGRDAPDERAIVYQDVSVTGYRTGTAGHESWLARLSRTLEATVLIEGPAGPMSRVERATRIAEEGGRVALVVTGERCIGDAALYAGEGFDIAWDAAPAHGSVGSTAAQLLDSVGERLCHIRLWGGGPEAATAVGRGVGEMMGRLALGGYNGTVILTPSSSRYRLVWQAWLGRRGGWGCGSRSADPGLVQLIPAVSEGEAR